MPDEPQFKINVPSEIAGGAYANFANVWHTPYEFTIDFAVLERAMPKPARTLSPAAWFRA